MRRVQTLITEFGDCLVLCMCDDVFILGPPNRAAAALARYRELVQADSKHTHETMSEPVPDCEPPLLAQVSSIQMMPLPVLVGLGERGRESVCFHLSVAPALSQFSLFVQFNMFYNERCNLQDDFAAAH